MQDLMVMQFLAAVIVVLSLSMLGFFVALVKTGRASFEVIPKEKWDGSVV